MKIKIIDEKKNDLFKRKEIKLEVSSSVTPSNADIEKWLAEHYKIDADAIKIKGIYGRFGSQVFSVEVNIYDSFEDKDKTEIKTKKQRNAEKKFLEERLKVKSEAKKTAAEEATKSEGAEKSKEESN